MEATELGLIACSLFLGYFSVIKCQWIFKSNCLVKDHYLTAGALLSLTMTTAAMALLGSPYEQSHFIAYISVNAFLIPLSHAFIVTRHKAKLGLE